MRFGFNSNRTHTFTLTFSQILPNSFLLITHVIRVLLNYLTFAYSFLNAKLHRKSQRDDVRVRLASVSYLRVAM